MKANGYGLNFVGALHEYDRLEQGDNFSEFHYGCATLELGMTQRLRVNTENMVLDAQYLD